ncbi:hypothetical protein BJ165DRAFT_1535134 [Panaeolus papilionaceus]|nr:hypothetical protein BJ165DRAFT_1535134 [Panaeolus papilionaceus]
MPWNFRFSVKVLELALRAMTLFLMHYIEGAAEIDGEVPERVWGANNEIGKSTSGQGPGNRNNNIDDNFSFWNYEKLIELGHAVLRRYQSSLATRNMHCEAHRGLSENVGAVLVKKWESVCCEWDADRSTPKKAKNPYENPEQAATMTEAEAKKELAEEKEERIKNGGVSYHETPASTFVSVAIEIEDLQRKILWFAKNHVAKSTATQAGGLIEQRNQLKSRIKAWEALLPVYMPGLQQFLMDGSKKSSEPIHLATNPEDHTLWLPSKISQEHRKSVCTPNLHQIEERLRTAQCQSSLEKLRHVLRIKSHLTKFKSKNMCGQREGTRSRAIIERVLSRAKSSAARYWHAREMKLALSGPGDWEKELQPLLDDDIRSYDDIKKLKKTEPRKGTLTNAQLAELHANPPPTNSSQTEDFTLLPHERNPRDGSGITTNELSWIWVGKKQALEGAEGDVILMVEWAKSWARSKRSEEELMLLKEEMRRILAYLEWRAKWWLSRATLRHISVDSQLREALSAYSTTCANHLRHLSVKFKSMWKAPLRNFIRENTTMTLNGILLELDADSECQKSGLQRELSDEEEGVEDDGLVDDDGEEM